MAKFKCKACGEEFEVEGEFNEPTSAKCPKCGAVSYMVEESKEEVKEGEENKNE